MTDFISVFIIIIFAFFTAKKLIIPRIIAKKAEKAAFSPATPVIAEGVKEKDMAAKIVSTPECRGFETRPVTFIEVREEPLRASEDEDPTTGDALAQRIEKTANEMLLDASLRGRNVQFNAFCVDGRVILYATYTT